MRQFDIGELTPTISVSDMEKSRFFYEKLIGLKVLHHSDDVVSYGFLSKSVICRIQQAKTSDRVDTCENSGVEFILQIGRAYQYASEPFETHHYPYDRDEFSCVVAYDPDGNKWVLAG